MIEESPVSPCVYYPRLLAYFRHSDVQEHGASKYDRAVFVGFGLPTCTLLVKPAHHSGFVSDGPAGLSDRARDVVSVIANVLQFSTEEKIIAGLTTGKP